MATEAPVNIAPPECSTAVSTAVDGFLWQRDSLNMHVIRPKSAKGRTRPSLPRPQGPEVCSSRAPSPPPAIPCESPSSQKPGACTPKSPNQWAPDEIPELLQQMPIGSSSSLNKYPVLPSIKRKSLAQGALETTSKKTSALQRSSLQGLYPKETGTLRMSGEDARARPCSLERKFVMQPKKQSSYGAGDLEEPSDQEPRLLLAVRSPSGRRFVRHFRPTDDLQTVVTVAEHKNKATYRHCSIETMEVPQRRFSDLTKSLQECGIAHRSALGIAREDREGWP